jgi:hypothetical protein
MSQPYAPLPHHPLLECMLRMQVQRGRKRLETPSHERRASLSSRERGGVRVLGSTNRRPRVRADGPVGGAGCRKSKTREHRGLVFVCPTPGGFAPVLLTDP